jgi:hypothetical protein
LIHELISVCEAPEAWVPNEAHTSQSPAPNVIEAISAAVAEVRETALVTELETNSPTSPAGAGPAFVTPGNAPAILFRSDDSSTRNAGFVAPPLGAPARTVLADVGAKFVPEMMIPLVPPVRVFAKLRKNEYQTGAGANDLLSIIGP